MCILGFILPHCAPMSPLFLSAILKAVPILHCLLVLMTSYFLLLFTPLTLGLCTACTTEVEISMAFGGKLWPINPVDMNLGTLPTGQCLGGIFDLTQGSDVGTGGGNPNWVVGDTFLVSNFLTCCPLRWQRLLKHKLSN